MTHPRLAKKLNRKQDSASGCRLDDGELSDATTQPEEGADWIEATPQRHAGVDCGAAPFG